MRAVFLKQTRYKPANNLFETMTEVLHMLIQSLGGEGGGV